MDEVKKEYELTLLKGGCEISKTNARIMDSMAWKEADLECFDMMW